MSKIVDEMLENPLWKIDHKERENPFAVKYVSEEQEANGYGRTRYQDLHEDDDPHYTNNPLE